MNAPWWLWVCGIASVPWLTGIAVLAAYVIAYALSNWHDEKAVAKEMEGK